MRKVPTYGELEVSLSMARLRLSHAEKRANANYDKLRRLENRIRSTIVVGEHVDTDALYALRISVPTKPRPTLTELRKGRR